MLRGGSPEMDKVLGMRLLRNAPVATLRPLLWITWNVFRILGVDLV